MKKTVWILSAVAFLFSTSALADNLQDHLNMEKKLQKQQRMKNGTGSGNGLGKQHKHQHQHQNRNQGSQRMNTGGKRSGGGSRGGKGR